MSSDSDVLVSAIASAEDLRIAAAVTTDVVRDAARRHRLSPPATTALGRALTSGLLLATMTKGDERVTLQLIGDGPIGSLTVDANAAGEVRGYARRPQAEAPLALDLAKGRVTLAPALGRHGTVHVTRDIGLRDLYQGQVALHSGEVDEDLEAYLHTSEQVPSALSCEVLLDEQGQVVRAAGILVQTLPGGEPETVREIKSHLHRGALHALVSSGDVSAQALVERLMPAHTVEFLSDRAVRFKCKCSQQRIRDTLHLLSVTELDEMIAEGKDAEVTCNFCNTLYSIDTAALVQIRAEVVGPRQAN